VLSLLVSALLGTNVSFWILIQYIYLPSCVYKLNNIVSFYDKLQRAEIYITLTIVSVSICKIYTYSQSDLFYGKFLLSRINKGNFVEPTGSANTLNSYHYDMAMSE